MKKLISAQHASQIILALIGLLIVFHLLVISKVVPSGLVWGNQLDEAQVLPIELISIVISISFGLFILIKMRYVKNGEKSKVVNIALWVIAGFLLYNSVMNVISEVALENFFFAPIALIMAILTMRLAIE